MELLMEKVMAALLLGATALVGSLVFIVVAWPAYILFLARWGTLLALADLTPHELLELKEEMRQTMAAEPDLPPENSSGFMPIEPASWPQI